MPSLPSPVRAALGLAATMLDEARHLPDRAIEMPMRAISRALALSLRAQQRYAALAARGEEILSGRTTTDEAPAWATFDAPVGSASDNGVSEIGASEIGVADATAADPAAADPGPADTGALDAAEVDTAELADPPPKPRSRPSKTVHAPRTGKASAFDAVPDE